MSDHTKLYFKETQQMLSVGWVSVVLDYRISGLAQCIIWGHGSHPWLSLIGVFFNSVASMVSVKLRLPSSHLRKQGSIQIDDENYKENSKNNCW